MSTAFILTSKCFSQNSFTVNVHDKITTEALPGVVVRLKDGANGTVSDSSGRAILTNIPDSLQIISYSLIGYKEKTETLIFPLQEVWSVYLEPEGESMDEVIVEATRSNRSIDNIPTCTEVF